MVALLVQSMERLDEQVKEEADGIYNTLGKEMYTNALTVTLQSVFILKLTVSLRLINILWTVHRIYIYIPFFFLYKATVTCPTCNKYSILII